MALKAMKDQEISGSSFPGFRIVAVKAPKK